jgi:hypothetical protein
MLGPTPSVLDRESIAGLKFQHSDYVRVTDEAHRGINDSLVSLEAIESGQYFWSILKKVVTLRSDRLSSASSAMTASDSVRFGSVADDHGRQQSARSGRLQPSAMLCYR